MRSIIPKLSRSSTVFRPETPPQYYFSARCDLSYLCLMRKFDARVPNIDCHFRISSCPIIRVPLRFGSSIDVILLKDVQNRGSQGDVVDVKRGFARNFLIPRKMAVYATKENKEKYLQAFAEERTAKETAAVVNEEARAALVKQLERFTESTPFLLARQTNTGGTLFAALSKTDIIEGLQKTESIHVSEVVFSTPIKTIGKHVVAVEGVQIVVELTAQS